MRDALELDLKAALAAALGVLLLAGSAHAQEAPPAWRPPAPIVPVFAQSPRPAPQWAPPVASAPDRRLDESDVALRAMFAASFPPQEALDGAFLARGYSTTQAALGFDLALSHRAVWWLFVGARVGSRWRVLVPPSGGGTNERVHVSGTDLLALAELRIPMGPVELTPDFAAGIAYAEVVQGDGSVARAAPRLSVGVSASTWVYGPVRLVARLGWDLYPLIDVNRFGHDIALGGPSLEIGLEWRPR